MQRLDLPEICQEDISSELVLGALLGIWRKREFVIMDLSGENYMIYGLEPPIGAKDVFTPNSYIPMETWNKLINWALNQGPEVFNLIDEFLDDPENKLEETLESLAHLKIISKENLELALNVGKPSFVNLIRRQFIKYSKLNYDFLCELARTELGDQPQAINTLQHTLKRLEKSNEIEYLGGGLYRWQSPKQP